MLMVGNVLGLLWLDEKPLLSETVTLPCLYSHQSLGLQKTMNWERKATQQLH